MRVQVAHPLHLVLAAALIGLALAFGGSLALGAVWLWLLLALVDLLWALLVALAVRAAYECAAGDVSAGDQLNVHLEVRSQSPLPGPVLTLRDGPHSNVFWVGPGRNERIGLPSRAEIVVERQLVARRGRYRLGPLLVGVEGPLGIWAWVRAVRSEHEIVVLPRLHPLPPWPLQQPEAYGGAVARHSPYTDPAVVVGTRPLLPGDSLRRIHWKRTAHTGVLHVREAEFSAGGQTLLVLDLAESAYRRDPGGEVLDRAVELTAGLCHAVLRGGASLSLVTTAEQEGEIRRVRGLSALPVLLEQLAAARPDGGEGLAARLPRLCERLAPPALVLLVTPAAPDQWAAVIPALQARGLRLAAVLCGDAPPRAVQRLHRLGCQAWAATSAAHLAGQLVPTGRFGAWGALQMPRDGV